MSSHVSDASLAAYVAGDPALDDVVVWAVEAHLEGCAGCRSRLTAGPSLQVLLDDVHERIEDGVRRGPGPVRSRRVRRWRHRWATWAMLPWVALTVTAVLTAFLLDRAFPHRPSLVLLLAPVAPLAGLTVAWSRRSDPSWEVVAGTARSGLELLLRRTVLVLATVLPPLAVAGWLLGQSPALWLLPCLSFTAATLLLGGWIGINRAAGLLAVAWLAVVAAPAIATTRVPVVVEPVSRPIWLAVAVVLSLLAVLRAALNPR